MKLQKNVLLQSHASSETGPSQLNHCNCQDPGATQALPTIEQYQSFTCMTQAHFTHHIPLTLTTVKTKAEIDFGVVEAKLQGCKGRLKSLPFCFKS
jgi:hypothetical protein